MRLQYIKDNQKNMRSEIFKGIKDSVSRGDLKASSIGKKIILPISFTVGPDIFSKITKMQWQSVGAWLS